MIGERSLKNSVGLVRHSELITIELKRLGGEGRELKTNSEKRLAIQNIETTKLFVYFVSFLVKLSDLSV